jgi:hypothetical protein
VPPIYDVQQIEVKARRGWLRALLVLAAALLLMGCIAPFVNAARFGGSIQRALEASLGRKVQFENIHFTLFSGPGFSLERVTIGEDPRYGLEPFAFVPVLEARVRLDKLLFGELRLSSLRLVDPSLNLVRNEDGTWNIVELVNRLTAPRHAPLNLFPALEVSDGRLDFKFGIRKTTLYIANSDLSIYPARSGKVYVEFSGSPARTDRAGNGFGHLRGSLNWIFHQRTGTPDQLAGDVTLDPSNLSELTTLFQGHDVGVHGTVSSNAHIAGPVNHLTISGELRLEDVHRWDLLPSSGEDWRIRYGGQADLPAQRLALYTVPLRSSEATPVVLQVHANDFLGRSDWSIFAELRKAPLGSLLPLAKRMGLTIPQDAQLTGTLDGVIGFSKASGLQGGVEISDAAATLPNVPPLRSPSAHVTISGDRMHFDRAAIETDVNGTLAASGDYYLASPRIEASLTATAFPVAALKRTMAEWFDPAGAFSAFSSGELSGQFSYAHDLSPGDALQSPAWSGDFQFANSTLSLPGLAVPLEDAQGRAVFNRSTFNLERFSARLDGKLVKATYRYALAAKRPERVHIEMPNASLAELQDVLEPTLEPQGLLARFRFGRRSVPTWLDSRNLEGDILIDQFSINEVNLGPFSSRFIWQGTSIRFPSVQVNLLEGLIRAQGVVSLASYSPRLRFKASIAGFPWKGGLLNAKGDFETDGVGVNAIRNVRSSGTFDGREVQLGEDNVFDVISGSYGFAFLDGRPNLHLSNVEASQDDDSLSGEAVSNENGNLVFDLAGSGRQLHFESSLAPENAAPSAPTSPNPAAPGQAIQ